MIEIKIESKISNLFKLKDANVTICTYPLIKEKGCLAKRQPRE